MTQIDFHILPSPDLSELFRYVARLVQKARGKDHRILIAVGDASLQQQVSDALWGAIPESFLPNSELSESDDAIQLTSSDECGDHHDVLINLRQDIPGFFSRFERVIEVVSQQPDWLTASRDRYRYYQDHGYPLSRHDLRGR